MSFCLQNFKFIYLTQRYCELFTLFLKICGWKNVDDLGVLWIGWLFKHLYFFVYLYDFCAKITKIRSNIFQNGLILFYGGVLDPESIIYFSILFMILYCSFPYSRLIGNKYMIEAHDKNQSPVLQKLFTIKNSWYPVFKNLKNILFLLLNSFGSLFPPFFET